MSQGVDTISSRCNRSLLPHIYRLPRWCLSAIACLTWSHLGGYASVLAGAHTLTCRKLCGRLAFGPRHIFRCQGSEEWPGFVRSISWETEHTAAALWCVRQWGGRDIEPSLQLTCIHYCVRTGWHGVQLRGDREQVISGLLMKSWSGLPHLDQNKLPSTHCDLIIAGWSAEKPEPVTEKCVSLNSTLRGSLAQLVKSGFSNLSIPRKDPQIWWS